MVVQSEALTSDVIESQLRGVELLINVVIGHCKELAHPLKLFGYETAATDSGCFQACCSENRKNK